MIDPLNITPKQDSAEKVAATQNVPANEKIPATEFNNIISKVNDLVAESNKKTTSLNNPNDSTFPTTKAVADKLADKVSISTSAEFTYTAATDAINVDTNGKAFILFTNSVVVTGLKTTGFKDGQIFIIKNGSNGLITIKHQSIASAVGNRFSTINNQDLSLKPNTWACFIYSELRQRIELIFVFGTDMLLSLANTGTVPRVVQSMPDGSVTSESIMEFEVHDETITGYSTLAALVQAYPTQENGVDIRKKGFQVICAFTTPPCIYKKCGDGNEHWLKLSSAGLIKMANP
jgi:hypothetical protein